MSLPHYPPSLPIEPMAEPPVASVTPPGSKSITNRALVLAALSSRGRPQTLTGCLDSEDVSVMVECLRRLEVYPPNQCVKVGDTPSDMQEGRNAGLRTIGVVKSRWTRRAWLRSGLEILVLGAFAGIAGFFFGNLLPTLLGVPAPAA